MRVTHLIDSGGFYGAEVMLLQLCIEQQRQGHSVQVISIRTRQQADKALDVKLREHHIQVHPWPMHALPDLRESLKILNFCKSNDTDVIHCHGYKGNILLGLLPKRLRKMPVITTVHGYTQQKKFGKMAINQWLDKQCLSRLDAVVLVSPKMTHQVPVKSIGKKLHIIPNGIPPLDHTSVKSPYVSLFSHDTFKIGALGRLSHEKNFSLLIHSMTLVLQKIPQAQLVIYGEGSERNRLETLIKDNGLSHAIQLPGYLDNTPAFFSDLDVFVNCSMTEGMPISLLEAMRQGCLMVATDIPASRYLLEEFNDPQQLCDLTPKALCESICGSAQKNSHDKIALKEYYQQTFNKKYTIATMAQGYSDVYALATCSRNT